MKLRLRLPRALRAGTSRSLGAAPRRRDDAELGPGLSPKRIRLSTTRDGVLQIHPGRGYEGGSFLLTAERAGKLVIDVLEADKIELVGLTAKGKENQRFWRGQSQRTCLGAGSQPPPTEMGAVRGRRVTLGARDFASLLSSALRQARPCSGVDPVDQKACQIGVYDALTWVGKEIRARYGLDAFEGIENV